MMTRVMAGLMLAIAAAGCGGSEEGACLPGIGEDPLFPEGTPMATDANLRGQWVFYFQDVGGANVAPPGSDCEAAFGRRIAVCVGETTALVRTIGCGGLDPEPDAVEVGFTNAAEGTATLGSFDLDVCGDRLIRFQAIRLSAREGRIIGCDCDAVVADSMPSRWIDCPSFPAE